MADETKLARDEAMIAAMQRRQRTYDLFYNVFSTADGREVLKILKEMAWFKKSTHSGEEGMHQHIRDSREGQRMLVNVIEDFVEKGKTGERPPMRSHAISNTAEVPGV